MADFVPKSEFDGYRVDRLLGEGGMGAVFLATDTVLERQVAIKFITSEETDPMARERFIIEARAIARLQHPNVVAIYRVGETDGYPYLVSEYVPGTPLDEIDLPISYEHALRLSIGIACGLTTAHARGVLHRDIKPANVILSDDGTVKLLDFGIAKLVEYQTPGMRSGPGSSPESVAPESIADSSAIRGAPSDATAVVSPMDTTVIVSSPPDAAVAGPPVDATAIVSSPPDASSVDEAVSPKVLQGTNPRAETELTAKGRLLGTPRFMAPELWTGAPASFQSDIYAFGVLIYTLLTGKPPHEGASVVELYNNILSNDALPLNDAAPFVEPEFAAVIDRCLCRDPGDRFESMNEVRSLLERLARNVKYDVLPDGNPYRGLNTFGESHQNLFFGRDSEIRLILERMNKAPFVLVAGDSGVGKSSLCLAGVLPRLEKWLIPKKRWDVVQLVPGRFPVRALAAVLAPLLGDSESGVTEAIRSDPGGVARSLRAGRQADRGLVIFIDQFEEMTTISDPDERGYATDLLSWLMVPSPCIRLLATARGDFLSRLAALPNIGDEISHALFFARSLSKERIREAIVGPARMKGVAFESQELVQELVASTGRAGGGLPLLQFALAELWDHRDKAKRMIPSAALDRMGGVVGAFNRHADDIMAGISDRDRREAKRLILALVSADGTRARRTSNELGASRWEVQRVLDILVRGRLLVAKDSEEGTQYEIAHETLISGWRTLARWLSTDADKRLTRERLRAAVKEWERLGRDHNLLWRGPQLKEVKGVAADDLSESETLFVRSSLRSARHQRVRRGLGIAALPVIAVLIYGGVQLKAWLELERRVSEALTEAGATLAALENMKREAADLRRRALRQFDAASPKRAEALWKAHLDKRDAMLPLFRRAGGRVETALLLDPRRDRVRQMYTSLLFDRALFAEQTGNTGEAGEMISRLGLYDIDGSWMRKWRAPGTVTLRTSPESAAVRLFRFNLGADDRLERESLKGQSSRTDALLVSPGSYIARVQAAGHVSVVRPFTVGRGERITLRVALPREGVVPDGFVYVPPGRFLFGSAADEGLRRDFFHNAPLHAVETRGYLIAKRETTFGEWLDYVGALAAAQRPAALPKVEKGGFQGALTVQPDDSGRWRILFQPTTVRYAAAEGDPVRYLQRDRRHTQDWRRFPVFGVTAKDAERYTRWLNETGRVPGARLCTDIEWEQGARGSDGREYPHGERLLPDDANFDATYGKLPETMGPDEVCVHPASNSPFGLCDMAGNVWEWTVSSLSKGEYAARGGSYLFGQNSARATDREVTEPSFRDVSVGVRVCADPAFDLNGDTPK